MLYCREFIGPYDLPYMGRERAAESFLTPEQLRRKQNAAALKQMGVLP